MYAPEAVAALLSRGESSTLEFKTFFDRETIDTVVAYANTYGGTVLLGIADNGAVRGATIGKEPRNDWLGQIKSATTPMIIDDHKITDTLFEAVEQAMKFIVSHISGLHLRWWATTQGTFCLV